MSEIIRKLEGKEFKVKLGMWKDYEKFVNSIPLKKVSEKKQIEKALFDAGTTLLVIGGTAWAIGIIYAQRLKEYIEFKE